MTNQMIALSDKNPTRAELRAIEAEWPLIEAELAVVEIECRLAIAPDDRLAMFAYRRALTASQLALAATGRGCAKVAA